MFTLTFDLIKENFYLLTDNHDGLQNSLYELVDTLKEYAKQGDYTSVQDAFDQMYRKKCKIEAHKLQRSEMIPEDVFKRTSEYLRLLTANPEEFAATLLQDILGNHPLSLEDNSEPRTRINISDETYTSLQSCIKDELQKRIGYFNTADRIELYKGLRKLLDKHICKYTTLEKLPYEAESYLDSLNDTKKDIVDFLVNTLCSERCGFKQPFTNLPIFEYCDLISQDEKNEPMPSRLRVSF